MLLGSVSGYTFWVKEYYDVVLINRYSVSNDRRLSLFRSGSVELTHHFVFFVPISRIIYNNNIVEMGIKDDNLSLEICYITGGRDTPPLKGWYMYHGFQTSGLNRTHVYKIFLCASAYT